MPNESPLFGMSLRHPPANVQAEQALLGAILFSNKARDRCGDLRPEHFTDETYGQIFARICERVDEGRAVDAVSLKGEFDPATLAGVLASMVAISTVPEYAREIFDCARRRELIAIGERLIAQSFAGEAPADLMLAATSKLDAMGDTGAARPMASLDQSIDAAITAMEAARERKGPAGVLTGFRAIDERLGGLEPATLTVLAARPGMGKSALGLRWAVNAAQSGVPVMLISLEMSSMETGRRVLSVASGVPITQLKNGWVNADQAGRLVIARRSLAGLPLTIEDSAGLTASAIAARARSARRKGLGMILVDHLHIVRPDDQDARQGATWAVGRISGAMKRIAKDCGIPVVLLAQLNRGVEGRDDKRPGLADLRQAGDIEQDADAVGFVYRPEYYMANEPEQRAGETIAGHRQRLDQWRQDRERVAGRAELIWAKVRDGSPGTDHLMFEGTTTSFTEASD